MKKLTQKQEAFCLAYIETGNASEAYRQAYNAERMKTETINNKAHQMLQRGDIGARLDELRAPVRERAMLTLESHLARLDDLSRAAEEQGQYAPAISAEVNRGKVAGLYVERLEHSGPAGGPTVIELVAPSIEEYRQARMDMLVEDDC